MPHCQIFPSDMALWAFQPFGPNDQIERMMFLGSHYRGFPVIKIGDAARLMIECGERVEFVYKGIRYIAEHGQVEAVKSFK